MLCTAAALLFGLVSQSCGPNPTSSQRAENGQTARQDNEVARKNGTGNTFDLAGIEYITESDREFINRVFGLYANGLTCTDAYNVPTGAGSVGFDTVREYKTVEAFTEYSHSHQLVITACCPSSIETNDIARAKDFFIWSRVANQFGSMAAGIVEFAERPRVFFAGYWLSGNEGMPQGARDVVPYVSSAPDFDLDQIEVAANSDRSFVEHVYSATLQSATCAEVASRLARRPEIASYRDPDRDPNDHDVFRAYSMGGRVEQSAPSELTWHDIAGADEFVVWHRGLLDAALVSVGVAQFKERGLVFFVLSWRP